MRSERAMHRRMVREVDLLSFQHTYVRRMAAAPTTEKQHDTMVRVGAYAGNSTRVDPLLEFIGQDPLCQSWSQEVPSPRMC